MMKQAKMLALSLAVGGMVLAGTVADAKPKLTPQQELDKRLEGRVPGKPVDCIYMPTVSGSQVYDKTAIVYDSGRTLYVQKPRTGVESLRSDDILVTRLTGSELCAIDTVQLRDRTSGFWRGFVGLDKFVPYTKPAKVAQAD
ncbi:MULTISPECIES: hypothetical protein [unclassified Novosphingobium]|uniref:hypothetical protein n=1 Tax=Novosphingobium TaxID=165696 RepID=UPI0015C91E16|nr:MULTISPECIES: hypothetical protein [unclassified Novosphingobium]NKJ40762.1 hypothetical protein [Novosphingobium sp. SG720]NMN03054.1 hypothetical protein [Novosphingobium sp. SG919]NMN86958.1 hypothetical protein [Novosphingobium sp. SG916]